MTFGAGGHSRALLDSIPDCHIIALDRDPLAFSIAEDLAKNRSHCDSVSLYTCVLISVDVLKHILIINIYMCLCALLFCFKQSLINQL